MSAGGGELDAQQIGTPYERIDLYPGRGCHVTDLRLKGRAALTLLFVPGSD